ncbi:polyprenyl synthetase family protein [bacterium]|nr:polyprenyl synthetase family protein [bacterium]
MSENASNYRGSNVAENSVRENSHPDSDSQAKLGAQLLSYPGMSEVENLIRSKFTSNASLLTEIPEYLLELGGKRIRPALTLCTADMCGIAQESRHELFDIAAGIELIHMATLLHDDIIDHSPLRRGKPSPHITFGESATLLAGDFLLVRAFSLCAHLDEFIVQETESACVQLTEGEILEAPLSKQICTQERSLLIAEKKTASLFGLAAVSGAHIANVPKEVEALLKTFGIELGIAFQVLDDVLDVVADEGLLGKRCGGDLVEQKPSIINVLWLESGDSFSKDVLLSETPPSEDIVKDALEYLRQGDGQGIVLQAKQIAEQRIQRAEKALNSAVAILQSPAGESRGGENGNTRAREFSSFAHMLLTGLLNYTVKRLK